MPEGDTIHRIAARLAPQLVGKTLERVTTQGLVRDLAGQTVTAVDAHGKHLVIALANGTTLRAHLGMNGRQLSLPRADGETRLARTSPGRVTLAIVTADAVHLWLGARTIEISARRAPMHGMAVAQLGPDILAEDFDVHVAATRAAAHANRPILDVLLDQRVVAGIGNIYKSEALFACGVEPSTPTHALSHAQLEQLYAAARTQMQASVAGGRESHRVYSRTGAPCPTCGAAIACAQRGDPPRWTWWCRTCQRLPPAPGTATGTNC